MNQSSKMGQVQVIARVTNNRLKAPSFMIEWVYFLVLIYANIGPAYGLRIPMAGAGILAGLAFLCLMHFGSSVVGGFRPIKFALACGISVLFIQGIIFEESLSHEWMRSFITWLLSLIVLQTLSFRKGFIHRFGVVAFFIGLASLPFMEVYVVSDEMIRIGGIGVALANPNFFGMWFGFCLIYFVITGLETKNYIIRIASGAAGIICFYLMALTVSRGALLGVAIAIVIAFEKVLKRSFLPILGLLCLTWFLYVSGVFDNLIGYYVHRGAEETGRSRLWAWAFKAFCDSWGTGVGFSNALIVDPSGGSYGPHNAFLFIGLSSGVIPLILFIAYLTQACRGAFKARISNKLDASYVLPLASFALLNVMLGDGRFMSAWHVVTFCTAIGMLKINRESQKSCI